MLPEVNSSRPGPRGATPEPDQSSGPWATSAARSRRAGASPQASALAALASSCSIQVRPTAATRRAVSATDRRGSSGHGQAPAAIAASMATTCASERSIATAT
ncbi:hypothetical protein D3C72_1499560 [compost metagenome]